MQKDDSKCGPVFPNSYISKELKRIKLKLIIMKKIRANKTYSYAILKDIEKMPFMAMLSDDGEIKNDVYNTIKALEHDGYIAPDPQTGSGTRRGYKMTARGLKALTASGAVIKRALKDISQLMGS
jgi:DNA-binding PadR family transcriptional regulator